MVLKIEIGIPGILVYSGIIDTVVLYRIVPTVYILTKKYTVYKYSIISNTI
jgi:hypothetical protein